MTDWNNYGNPYAQVGICAQAIDNFVVLLELQATRMELNGSIQETGYLRKWAGELKLGRSVAALSLEAE